MHGKVVSAAIEADDLSFADAMEWLARLEDQNIKKTEALKNQRGG